MERSWDISLVARPYMEHLCRETGASVMLSIYEGGSVITLDQVESREGLRIVSDIGSRLPVFLHVPGEGIFSVYVTGRAGTGDPCHPCGHVDGGAEGYPPGLCCPGQWPGSGAAACC